MQQDRVLRAYRGVYERGSVGGRRKRTMWVNVGVLLHRWGVDLCAGSEKGDGLKCMRWTMLMRVLQSRECGFCLGNSGEYRGLVRCR